MSLSTHGRATEVGVICILPREGGSGDASFFLECEKGNFVVEEMVPHGKLN